MKANLRQLNIFLILFFGISLFFYILINGGAFTRNLRYVLFLNSPFASSDLRNGDILAFSGDPNEIKQLESGEYQLYLPKIDTRTPIIVPKENSTKAILAGMEEGVSIYPDSAPISEKVGRSVILGHSSRASWYRGDYATVFSLLPQMKVGDKFFVISKNQKLTYEVFAVSYMNPADTNAELSKPTNFAEVDLITCYPIGGASKRNLVQAKLVDTENL